MDEYGIKERLSGLLEARDTGDHGCSSPYYPVVIVYLGKNSLLFDEPVIQKLTTGKGGWGEVTSLVPRYVFDNGTFKTATGDEISGDTFRADITRLLGSGEAFSNPSGISLYFILDTDSVDDNPDNTADDFERLYYEINIIRDMLDVPLMTMLMVMLNDELNFRGKSVLIKKRICDIYTSNNNTHLYNCVFVIGRRFRSGAYSAIGDTGSDVVSNIMLLSNSSCSVGFGGAFYNSSSPALTVAYAKSAKPAPDIAVITLRVIMSRLSRMLDDDNTVLRGGVGDVKGISTALTKSLEIDKGRSLVYERIFDEVSDSLPHEDCFDLFPVQTNLSKTFSEGEKSSFGMLSAFLEQNHFKIINARMDELSSDISSQISFKIRSYLTAAHLYEGIEEDIISRSLEKAGGIFGGINDNISVFETIKIRMKNTISENMELIIRDTLDLLVRKSRECVSDFLGIKRAVDMIPLTRDEGTGMHLLKFYTDKANRFFNTENSLRIFKKVFDINNDEGDILTELFSAMEECFKSDKVYRYSYIDEMYERLGINDIHIATNQILGELVENLPDLIRFYSPTVFPSNPFLEAYFMNTAVPKHSTENGLYKRLLERELPPNAKRVFFDTFTNDTVESMWFYECRESDLSCEF